MTDVIVPTPTIHRVMHEIKRRRLEVLRVADLTPRMRRITLGGPELGGQRRCTRRRHSVARGARGRCEPGVGRARRRANPRRGAALGRTDDRIAGAIRR